MINNDVKLVLDNGTELYGTHFGAFKRTVGEIITNSSAVGYQEIITDPGYAGQIVVMNYPMIGHYGITAEDNESRTPALGGMVIREGCDTPSNFRYIKTLGEEFEEHNIPCICGLDTRMLSRLIRDGKCSKGAIVEASMPKEDALALIVGHKKEKRAVETVSCTKRWFARTAEHKFNLVAIDCGIKYSLISTFNHKGCNVAILPFNCSVEDMLTYNPDGIIVSSGPGSAEEIPEVIEKIKAFIGKKPIFGIGLGLQAVGLAYGAKVCKLQHGHHGGHPVRDLENGRIYSSEQNHGYTLDKDSIEGTGLSITHIDVLDGTIEGIENKVDKVFAVQFYPEGAPDPNDNLYLFDKFIKMMEE